MLFERPPLTTPLRGVPLFQLPSVISASSQSAHSTSHDSHISLKVHCVPSCSVAQSCLTLCDPTDCSLPGFSGHGISQARILELVAISSSRGSSGPRAMSPENPALAGRFFTIEPPYPVAILPGYLLLLSSN